MAQGIGEAERLRAILQNLRKVIIHRALIAEERSTESFAEEIASPKAVDEALRNL